jgi:hypothetical protein
MAKAAGGSPPCEHPAALTQRPPLVVHVPVDVGLLCGYERFPELRLVEKRAQLTVPVHCEPYGTVEPSSHCRFHLNEPLSAGQTYVVRDGAQTIVAAFVAPADVRWEGLDIPAKTAAGDVLSFQRVEAVGRVPLVPRIEAVFWAGECYRLPPGVTLDSGREYAWLPSPRGGIAASVVAADQPPAGAMVAPALFPRNRRLSGACGPHAAVEFVPAAPAAETWYRWEVHAPDGALVEAPKLGPQPVVLEGEHQRTLRIGHRYVLHVQAINLSGSQSPTVTVPFTLDYSCRELWRFWSAAPWCGIGLP